MLCYNAQTGEWNDSLAGEFLWSNVNVSEAVPDVMTPSRSLESSLALYRANRRHIVDLIEHIPGACEKSALLQRPGKEDIRITVFDVIELHVQHLTDHIKDIEAIRHAHNA